MIAEGEVALKKLLTVTLTRLVIEVSGSVVSASIKGPAGIGDDFFHHVSSLCTVRLSVNCNNSATIFGAPYLEPPH